MDQVLLHRCPKQGCGYKTAETVASGLCPNCGSRLFQAPDGVDVRDGRITDLERQLAELQAIDVTAVVESALAAQSAETAKITADRDWAQARIVELTDELAAAQADIATLTEKLAEANKQHAPKEATKK